MKTKKQQILEVALKLFNTQGFNETPTSQISKEAGVATGTLFHHFPTKDDLINCLYLACKDNMIKNIVEDMDVPQTYEQKMKTLCFNCIKWGVENPEEYTFFMRYSHSPYITKFTREEGLSRIGFLNNLILEGIQSGTLKNLDADFLLAMSNYIIFSLIEYYIENPDQYLDKKFHEEACQCVWDAIRK